MTMAVTPSSRPESLARGLIVVTTSSSVTTLSLWALGMWLTGDGPGAGGMIGVGDVPGGEGWGDGVTLPPGDELGPAAGGAAVGLPAGDGLRSGDGDALGASGGGASPRDVAEETRGSTEADHGHPRGGRGGGGGAHDGPEGGGPRPGQRLDCSLCGSGEGHAVLHHEQRRPAQSRQDRGVGPVG